MCNGRRNALQREQEDRRKRVVPAIRRERSMHDGAASVSLTAGFRFCDCRRQGQRSLSERITPTGRRANVGVAEPQAPLEGHTLIDTLEPEPRRNDCRVSPDPDNLRALVLVLALVDDLAGTCGFQKILARVCLAVAEYQHEIVGEDPTHGLRVVTLDCRLVLGVERRDAGAIVVRRSHYDGSDGQKRRRCQCTTEIELHVSSSSSWVRLAAGIRSTTAVERIEPELVHELLVSRILAQRIHQRIYDDDAQSRVLDPARNSEPAERLVVISELGIDLGVLIGGGLTQASEGCCEPGARLLGVSELRSDQRKAREALPLDRFLLEFRTRPLEIAGLEQRAANAAVHGRVVRIQALGPPCDGYRFVVAARSVVCGSQRDVRSWCDRVELHGLRAGLDGLLGLPDPERETCIDTLDLRAPR